MFFFLLEEEWMHEDYDYPPAPPCIAVPLAINGILVVTLILMHFFFTT